MKIANTVAAVFLLMACGSEKNEKPNRAEPMTGPSCPAQVDELSAWMETLRSEGGHEWPAAEPLPGPNLVVTSVATAQPPTGTAVLGLTRDEVSVEGTIVGGQEVDREKLEEFLRALAVGVGESGNAALLFAVDGKVSWSKVVDAVAASSRAGYSNVAFLFAGPPSQRTLSPPPASSIAAEIAAARRAAEKAVGEGSAETLAFSPPSGYSKAPDLFGRIAADCAPLQKVFQATAEIAPADRARHLSEAVVAAIGECDCRADIPALKELYWYLVFGRHGIATRCAIVAPVSSEVTGATVVAAPASSEWQDVFTKVLDVALASDRPKVVLRVE